MSTDPLYALGPLEKFPLLIYPQRGRCDEHITGDSASFKGRSGGIGKETLPNQTLRTAGNLEMKMTPGRSFPEGDPETQAAQGTCSAPQLQTLDLSKASCWSIRSAGHCSCYSP